MRPVEAGAEESGLKIGKWSSCGESGKPIQIARGDWTGQMAIARILPNDFRAYSSVG